MFTDQSHHRPNTSLHPTGASLGLVAFALIASMAFGIFAWSRFGGNRALRIRGKAHEAQTQGPAASHRENTGRKEPPANRVEVVPITVRATGFEPGEIEYPSKPFLLALDNQSGIENVALQLYQQDGEGKSRSKIHELRVSLTSLSKREIIDLKPGDYVLKEANHPDWTCRITITLQ